ncbi:MAG: thiamine pyrophosphate-binding protein, partial [Dehalococcoidia bacterium]
MAKLTGAHLAVRSLKLEGIENIFTLVGDHILPLCDAAVDEGLRFIDTRHEAAAVHMADGWTRVTGRPAVCMTTGGPGHANAIGGMGLAFTAESPVVVINGSSELAHRGKLAFQELDQVGMMAPVTKEALLVPEARRIPEFIARAFRTALEGRPGPVYLCIPLDVQEQPVSEEDLPSYQPQEYRPRGRSPGDPQLIEEAVALLRRAERPVVIVDAIARYQLPPEVLLRFIETTRLPLFALESARGMVSEEHPLCFGDGEASVNDAMKLCSRADVVLLLGKRIDYRVAFGRFFSPEAKLLQVDPSPAEIGRNRGVAVGIVGHLGAVVEQLTQAASRTPWGELPWLEELRSARRAQREALASQATDDLPLHAMRVFRELEPLLDEHTWLIFDGGDFVQWGRTYLQVKGPAGSLRIGPLGHLGAGLPFALATKLAFPDDRVVLFIGDGSFGFYPMEFDTAVRHHLPIVAVLGNDSLWGIDRNFQLEYYGRAVATELRWVRYDKIVEALDGYAELVERPEELALAFQRALASAKPSLLNVRVRNARSP